VAIVFLVLTVAVVVAIGLLSVGRVTAELGRRPPPSLFDLEEAVGYVADRLPFDEAASLTYEDVERILGWHLDYLEAKRLAARTEGALIEEQADGGGPIVAEDDEGVAYVLGEAGRAGLEVQDVQVVVVLELEMAYLRAIGAVGSAVEPPADPGVENPPKRG
jgi:hypothetical protein